MIPRPGENVKFIFTPSQALIDHPTYYVTYCINQTSNDYLGFGVNTFTVENVSLWMQGTEYYSHCSTGRDLNKCTQTVALKMKAVLKAYKLNKIFFSNSVPIFALVKIIMKTIFIKNKYEPFQNMVIVAENPHAATSENIHKKH